MSFSVKDTTITLTRGDTFIATINICNPDGSPYIPVTGDKVRFAMKNNYKETEPVLVKDIPIDTLILTIEPDDTKNLTFGKFVYDIQLTKNTGEVDTFITKATLQLTEEVY